MTQDEFQFEPPPRRQMWNNLSLTMAQAAALTGASERQIQHWMDRGYLRPASAGSRRINGASLDMIVLIRQARASGTPLRQAVAASRLFLTRESGSEWETFSEPALLDSVRARVATAARELESIESLLVQRPGAPSISRKRFLGVE